MLLCPRLAAPHAAAAVCMCVCVFILLFTMETAIHIVHTEPGQGWGEQDAA